MRVKSCVLGLVAENGGDMCESCAIIKHFLKKFRGVSQEAFLEYNLFPRNTRQIF